MVGLNVAINKLLMLTSFNLNRQTTLFDAVHDLNDKTNDCFNFFAHLTILNRSVKCCMAKWKTLPKMKMITKLLQICAIICIMQYLNCPLEAVPKSQRSPIENWPPSRQK